MPRASLLEPAHAARWLPVPTAVVRDRGGARGAERGHSAAVCRGHERGHERAERRGQIRRWPRTNSRRAAGRQRRLAGGPGGNPHIAGYLGSRPEGWQQRRGSQSRSAVHCPAFWQCTRLCVRAAHFRRAKLGQPLAGVSEGTATEFGFGEMGRTGAVARFPALAGHRNGEAQRRGQPHEPARRWAPPRASVAWYAGGTRQAGQRGAAGLADELWAAGGGR